MDTRSGMRVVARAVGQSFARARRRREAGAAAVGYVVQQLEPRRLLASVVVFDDPNYVDTADTVESESDNIQASLAAAGHTVTTFTGVTAAEFGAALAGKSVLVIPEQEVNLLAPDLGDEAVAVIRDYVAAGGGLIINGFAGDSPGVLNKIFGYQLQEVFGSSTARSPEAGMTAFAAATSFLPFNDGTSGLVMNSLPDDAVSVYDDGFQSTVTRFSHGRGEIMFLGWDWYLSSPPAVGGQNGGWQQILALSMIEVTTLPNANAPTAHAGGPYEFPEGGSTIQVVLDGSASSDPNQASGTLNYAWDLDRDGLFGETGAAATRGNELGANPTFTAPAPGGGTFDGPTNFRVALRVRDSSGLVDVSTRTVRVVNVAPTAGITGPTSAGIGEFVDFTLTATDVSPQDAQAGFGYEVDWGDGTSDFFGGDGAGTVVPHAFLVSGTQTISVVARDKDGGASAPATWTVNVAPTSLTTDPADPGKTALFVAGTSGDDVIRINSAKKNRVEVVMNGASLGAFSPTGRIIVFGGPGGDDIQVANAVSLPAELNGGDGDDTLGGGGGNDIAVGRDGNDQLRGGNGRDLLIGGFGADTVDGQGGDDLVIAGVSNYEFNEIGRRNLMAEWTRTDQGYERRVDHLRFGGGLNAFDLIDAFGEDESDRLSGGGGHDWFFASTLSPVGPDVITDLKRDEFSTETPHF